MVTWTMEEDVAQTVLDILDSWIDGHDEATDDVVLHGVWASAQSSSTRSTTCNDRRSTLATLATTSSAAWGAERHDASRDG
jgi:hypothetical protein